VGWHGWRSGTAPAIESLRLARTATERRLEGTSNDALKRQLQTRCTDLDNQFQALQVESKPRSRSNPPPARGQSSTITTAPNTISPGFARSLGYWIGPRSRIRSGVMTARLCRSAARAGSRPPFPSTSSSMRRARAR